MLFFLALSPRRLSRHVPIREPIRPEPVRPGQEVRLDNLRVRQECRPAAWAVMAGSGLATADRREAAAAQA